MKHCPTNNLLEEVDERDDRREYFSHREREGGREGGT